MTSARVLVVEDDDGLRDVLARGLRRHAYDVVTARDGAGGLRAAEAGVDAVVLDVGLPDSDGRDVCQALRARGLTVPVLFLTARDALPDRLAGFAAGGDDYLAKPFALAELVARLEVALRRSGSEPGVRDGELLLDPVTHALSAGGESVPLTPTEFRLLARLLTQPGAVTRRHELVAAGWPAGAIVSDNTLDSYVARLRRKLRGLPTDRAIEGVRGVGYRLAQR
ncbi:two-component system response regulator MprA [Motilibacter rhizosphaerae]|uniref:Two-component system response regulator MprA n=1 Tax=Motilibacter rhizosphaerae TaxID=598652 RepID=A0A4Q7NS13_9ACTN|nr:response regulator transcription factor [Motilibacter rhizosphaerae]RZS87440.1 two-component system response regulator MprA [Motilibacter rhizosphaerae]